MTIKNYCGLVVLISRIERGQFDNNYPRISFQLACNWSKFVAYFLQSFGYYS